VNDFLERVGENIRARGLFRPGQAILVAVSGGVDSMVLLHALHRLSAKNRWKLTVAHFNHQLRGAESDADESLVRKASLKMGLPFVSERWGGGRGRQIKESGLEMAARRARHDFWRRVMERLVIPTAALAHHADDQAELFFLRLIRGAGTEGLSGMKWTSGVLGNGRQMVRPLLNVTKAELLAQASVHHISFREDDSNRDRRRERNRIRHELLPRLREQHDPAIVSTILRTMDILGADSDCIRETAARWLQRERRAGFERLHPAVQRECVRRQLMQLGVAGDFQLVEFLRLNAGGKTSAGPGCTLFRDMAGRVHRQTIRRLPFNPDETVIHFTGERGKLSFGGVKITWELSEAKAGARLPRPAAGREFFAADHLWPRCRLRHWRPGDRFQPIGMSAPVKLQDLFTNEKVPRERRRELLVAETMAGEIFWVEGLRLGEQFKLDKATARRLKWHWQRLS